MNVSECRIRDIWHEYQHDIANNVEHRENLRRKPGTTIKHNMIKKLWQLSIQQLLNIKSRTAENSYIKPTVTENHRREEI